MKDYQSRYIAFARSKGLTPEECEKKFSVLDFILWMNERWNNLGKKLGFRRDQSGFYQKEMDEYLETIKEPSAPGVAPESFI